MSTIANECRGRFRDVQDVVLRKSILFFCIGFLLFSGCASVKAPERTSGGDVRPGRIAVLPVVNLSNTPAPLAAIRQALSEKLQDQGFDIVDEAKLADLLEKMRMRDMGGLGSLYSRQFKDAGVTAVIITSLELYSIQTPPKFAISARMVATGENPAILWAESVSLAGDDAPGLLGLGLIEDVNILFDQATTSLVSSLVKYASGSAGRPEKSSSA